MHLIR